MALQNSRARIIRVIGALVAEATWRVFVFRPRATNTRVLFVEDENESAEVYLGCLLRRFPQWAAGHLRYAQSQLARKERVGAYASACAAAEILGLDAVAPRLLFAQVYLQSSREASAVEILETLLKGRPGSYEWQIREELAAGYLSLGDKQRAHVVLAQIPSAARNSRVITALRFLEAA